MINEKPSLDDTLQHYGVKGMRWGVRRAYADRRQFQANTLHRVADGTANAREKRVALLSVSAKDLRRGRGLQGAAKIRGDEIQGHVDRVLSGQEKTKDLLIRLGTTNSYDLVRGGRDKYRKPSTPNK